MMKLWILRPVDGMDKVNSPWTPAYDKAHGFVVRAKTSDEARRFANSQGGDESRIGSPWLSEQYSTCVELKRTGAAGVVLIDFNAG